MEEKIQIGQDVSNMTEEERKEIRMSFEPDVMGFENEEEGIINDN